MWNVEYIANNDSQPWSTRGFFDNEEKAIKKAAHASDEYYMVKVTAPDGSVIWVN